MSKPNILFIMTDQQSTRGVGAYGGPAITPNIDAMASGGVRFENVACPSPICVTSRSSFICGKHPHRNDIWDNGSPFACDEITLPYRLAAAGYRTLAAGKLHFIGADQLHGFHDRLTPDVYPADMLWVDDWDNPMTRDNGNNRDRVAEAGVIPWSPTFDYDEHVMFRSLEWLRLHARQKPEEREPFFLFVGLTNPHDPYQTLQELWDRYEGVDIELPENWDQPFDELSQMSQWIQMHHDLAVPVKREDAIRARRAYFANCSYIDDKVGLLVAELERLGLRDNTIIFFVSDHGDTLGAHGGWSKRMFYEGSVKVPMIAQFPHGENAGRVVNTPVSLLDVYPTLLEIADAPVPDDIDGVSLMPLATGSTTERGDVFSEFCADGVLSPCRMIQRGNYKLNYCHGHKGELFDLAADPNEMKNLIDDPAHAVIRDELLAKIMENWNPDEIDRRIRESQKRRRALAEIRLNHEGYPWKFVTPGRGPEELRKGIGIGCGPIIDSAD